MPSLTRVAAACAGVLLLAGCATGGAARHGTTLDGTAWILASPPADPGPGRATPTLRFADGEATGTDGCNRFRMPYRAEGGTLAIGPGGASTRMACPPPVAQRADAFQGVLAAARAWRVQGERLELLGTDGKPVAAFTPQPQALSGTAWRVTGYNNGRGAVASVLAGTRITLAFSDGGKAGGFGGCNRYSAGYTAEAGGIRITAPVATRMACLRPEGVMAQEQAYFAALVRAATTRFEGERAELRDASGALVVSLVRDDQRP